MKIRVNREKLLTLASSALGATEVKSPLLKNFLIRTSFKPPRIEICATDTAVFLAVFMLAEVIEEGTAMLDARAFCKRLSTINDEVVNFSSGKDFVISGKKSKTTLLLGTDTDFPTHPVVEGNVIEINGLELAGILDRVSASASRDSSRGVLQSIYLDSKSGMISATNGLTLAALKTKIRGEFSISIPNTAAGYLKAVGLEGKIRVQSNESWISFKGPKGQLLLSLNSGKYPDGLIDSVEKKEAIPPNAVLTLVMDDLKKAIDYALYMSENTLDKTISHAAKLVWDPGGIRLEIAVSDVGNDSEIISGSFTGKPGLILVSPKLMGEALAGVTKDRVQLKIWNPSEPIIIVDPYDKNFRSLMAVLSMKVGTSEQKEEDTDEF